MGKNIAIITGSVREGNYTTKAANLIVDELMRHEGVEVDFINAADLTLGLPGVQVEGSSQEEIQKKIESATGVILATPEYHGSFSSVMKLIIDNLGFPSKLSGKPVALLGVAAGRIGAIKALEHLRSVCSHIGAIVLPGPVSVANVQQVFDKEGKCSDEAVIKQIHQVGSNLLDYIDQHICPRIALENMARREKSGI